MPRGDYSGEYLLEVRSEEIPARMLEPGVKELATRVFEELMARGIAPSEVETGFTPRRLVLILSGLPEREADREEQVMGPPVRAAFGADGAPTQALLGFAKRTGLEPDQLARVTTDKGEYLAATKKIAGRATREVLAEIVPRILTGISWAKTMRWGSGEGPWVRPIHGIVSLLDGEVVPFDLFGIAAGDESFGHPTLSPAVFRVESVEDYRSHLAARALEVSPAERGRTLHDDHARPRRGAGRPAGRGPGADRKAGRHLRDPRRDGGEVRRRLPGAAGRGALHQPARSPERADRGGPQRRRPPAAVLPHRDGPAGRSGGARPLRQRVGGRRPPGRRPLLLWRGPQDAARPARRAAPAPELPREAGHLRGEDRADRGAVGRDLRPARLGVGEAASGRRGPPAQGGSHDRDGQGVHLAAGDHGRHLRPRGRGSGGGLAGDLRSIHAGLGGRPHPARPGRAGRRASPTAWTPWSASSVWG